MRTADLTGSALDWAVAKCEGYKSGCSGVIPYSTDWAQGGPIIEREEIAIDCDGLGTWCASDNNKPIANYGPTPLLAAMRCYVASKLGEFVDIPEELK